MFMSVVSSCSKDKDSSDSLEGTTWKATVPDDDWVGTITFVDNTSYTFMDSEGGNTHHYSGTYSYNKPTITLWFDGEKFTGTISGNKATITMWGYTYYYYKQ